MFDMDGDEPSSSREYPTCKAGQYNITFDYAALFLRTYVNFPVVLFGILANCLNVAVFINKTMR